MAEIVMFIRKLLETSIKPLIEYIQLKLSNLLLEAESEEKQVTANVHNDDIIMGGNVQKVEHGNANMKKHKELTLQIK